MAEAKRGKFEVDVTELKLSAKELDALDAAIQKTVLSHLVGMQSKVDFGRAFGRPGHTDGIWVRRQDLERFSR